MPAFCPALCSLRINGYYAMPREIHSSPRVLFSTLSSVPNQLYDCPEFIARILPTENALCSPRIIGQSEFKSEFKVQRGELCVPEGPRSSSSLIRHLRPGTSVPTIILLLPAPHWAVVCLWILVPQTLIPNMARGYSVTTVRASAIFPTSALSLDGPSSNCHIKDELYSPR